MMNRTLWFVVFLTLSVLAAGASKRNSAEIDKVLQTAVDQKLVPHVVAVVATANGVVYEGDIGLKKDAIFAIASMTKPVTAVAVMQLVEAGKIKLDEPAAASLEQYFRRHIFDPIGMPDSFFNTFFWIDREKSVCAVLMTQMLPFGDEGPTRLLGDFERAV
jgi:CubicO group peptidase (beta-lactamase class C family)